MHLLYDKRFSMDAKSFLDSMDEDNYRHYLKHIVSVIKRRTKIIQGGKNEV